MFLNSYLPRVCKEPSRLPHHKLQDEITRLMWAVKYVLCGIYGLFLARNGHSKAEEFMKSNQILLQWA